jgi:hypothetical protein
MRKPTKEDPMLILLGAMITGDTSGEIVAQEKRGQTSFVKSDTLPLDMKDNAREVLVALGVQFHGVVEDDPIFEYVTLPPGWTKRPTDHDMWSELLDERGRVRANIFYKAAFYDRSSMLHLAIRFSYGINYDRCDTENVIVSCVYDHAESGKVLFSTEPVPCPPPSDRTLYRIQNAANEITKQWLVEHYPDWYNPAAYWD